MNPLASFLRAVARTLALLALVCPGSAWGAPTEYDVKAAYLVQFTRFITWPAPDTLAVAGPLTIGVYGRDPSGGALRRTIEKRPVGGRTYRCVTVSTLDEARRCRLVYIPGGEEKRAGALADSLRAKGVLTVGETAGFFDAGGMLRMRVLDKRVRFDVNLGVLDAAGFQVSSNMLRVAELVRRGDSAERR